MVSLFFCTHSISKLLAQNSIAYLALKIYKQTWFKSLKYVSDVWWYKTKEMHIGGSLLTKTGEKWTKPVNAAFSLALNNII